MKIINRLLVLVLMSMMTSVVCAQTQASKKNDVVKLSEQDVALIERTLSTNKYIAQDDKSLAMFLIHQDNVPQKGILTEDEEIIPQAKTGDEWTAYISRQDDSYWLTYIVSREDKFVGRLDIRIN